MSAGTFFLLGDSRRRKFLLLVLSIAVPVLLLSIYLVTRYEAKSDAEGHPNDRGGTTFYYRERTGLTEFPKPIGQIIKPYPQAEFTYLNISSDKSGKYEGTITGFTQDDYPKVFAFYKQGAMVTDEKDDRIELVQNNCHYRVLKVSSLNDDPVHGQNKFEIFFY